MLTRNETYVHTLKVFFYEYRRRNVTRWVYCVVNPTSRHRDPRARTRAISQWQMDRTMQRLFIRLAKSSSIAGIEREGNRLIICMRVGEDHQKLHGCIEKSLRRDLSMHCSEVAIAAGVPRKRRR